MANPYRENRDYYNELYREGGYGSRANDDYGSRDRDEGGYWGRDRESGYGRSANDEDRRGLPSYSRAQRDRDDYSHRSDAGGAQGYGMLHGQGAHRGKGPKGYSRSDDRIREDVCDALMEDADLDASDIEVTVKKGEVTLQGQVDSRQDKRRAEDCADACAGVTNIQNNLKLRSAAASGTSKSGETRA